MIILIWFLTILTFIIGFLCGTYYPKDVKEMVDRAKTKMKRIKTKTRLGGINRPPEEELEKRGTVQEEEEKEMERVLEGKL